ncbi:MAG: sugar phosphate isomerase/epimerase [Planctomycetes bacterium]|nr:sugar phosphate isomerase/epimerase [Planctomycetota bacterium]
MPARKRTAKEPFGYCLNTSTIKGQKLGIVEEVEIAAKAGYDGIEPWIGELDAYVKSGGKLKDLGKRIKDAGLTVESAIGFFEFVLDDETRRRKAFDEAKRNMEMLKVIGGKRIAAPPFGHQDAAGLDLWKTAERYARLCELGDEFDVLPMLEFWGFSKSLNRLGEALLVATECGHPKACILCDVYHLYKGCSPYEGLKLLGPNTIGVMHMNDVPKNFPPEKITDADRVWPGDGIAPLKQILRDLRDIGFTGPLSLELFNAKYYKMDALECAKTGLKKTREIVRKSL